MGQDSPANARPIKRHAFWRFETPAFRVGAVLWLLALVTCILVKSWFLFTILFPLWTPLVGAVGRFNIGTPENPFYEFTPIHMAAGLMGILLSSVLYMIPVALWFKWRDRHTSGGR